MGAAEEIINMVVSLMGLKQGGSFQQVLQIIANTAQSKEILTDEERIQIQEKIQSALSEAGLLKGHNL
ncbi:hypothetical protein [Deinococcus cellulosilyticus]|uniref:Uncharacterized protein n=1 Tax=Deinococcus cellulosilyticus (strain DSM 18568 / NBRC 106333 / KACC 11606 / 5516J-15) TaxID=1223518 RepID=A0A511N4Q2_DEIC1|nr:hypothetical protein [Deinococcus cellulosilyticus]GEM47844.1 hypothetical protein DC3_34790 [Deinococcus cellulosilyticus NBRC 106333 = KACC 11606]